MCPNYIYYMDMEENNCLVCHCSDEEGTLHHLPCTQCNHEGIENQKYIHDECILKAMQMQLEEGYEDAGTRCPYCNTTSLVVKTVEKLDYLKWFKKSWPTLTAISVTISLLGLTFVLMILEKGTFSDRIRFAANLMIVETLTFIGLAYACNMLRNNLQYSTLNCTYLVLDTS